MDEDTGSGKDLVSESGYASEMFVSFQGEGPHAGERQLFVRLAVCNLRCRYCDTPDSLDRTPYFLIHRSTGATDRVENPLRASELAKWANALLVTEGPIDAIALTGGEPLVQASFLASFLRHARFRLPILLETNGVLPEGLTAVLPWVTIISMDIKCPSNTGERALWDEHQAFLRIAEGKETYVKVLVDSVTTAVDVAHAARLVASQPGEPLLCVQPIMGRSGRPDIDYQTLSCLYQVARRFHRAVRVIPQMHKVLGIR